MTAVGREVPVGHGSETAPFRSFNHLVGAQQDHVRNIDAEPKRWMRMTAPVSAACSGPLPLEYCLLYLLFHVRRLRWR